MSSSSLTLTFVSFPDADKNDTNDVQMESQGEGKPVMLFCAGENVVFFVTEYNIYIIYI